MRATSEPIQYHDATSAAWVGQQGTDATRSAGRHDLRSLSRQLSDDIAVMVASVHSLADLADQHDDPRMHRFAATSRKRMVSVISTAESLRDATASGAPDEQGVHYFDLRHAVNRALREATFVSGQHNVWSDLGGTPLLVTGEQFDTERAITHLVTTTMHYSTAGSARITLRPTRLHQGRGESDAAVITLAAQGSMLSAAEIARIISRFESADGAHPAHGWSSIRLVGGEVHATGASVEVRSSRAGTTFTAYWPIDRG